MNLTFYYMFVLTILSLCHVDCIGSAFNIKGAMQCPNCRKIEKGQWLYANGSRSYPEFSTDDWTHDEDLYDLSYSEMVKSCFFFLEANGKVLLNICFVGILFHTCPISRHKCSFKKIKS
jgi:hypothetical protein